MRTSSAVTKAGAPRWWRLVRHVCRAIAAAVVGSADKVKYVALSAPLRFAALQSGEVDLLSRNTTLTLARDASMGLQLTAVDASQLATLRVKYAQNPADHVILPDVIANEPLGPLERRGDDDWAAIVRWVLYGLIEAEEQGVSQANVEQRRLSDDPAMQRLLGGGGDIGKPLGLDPEWLLRVLRATGNYGDIFERNLGPATPVALPRGLNNLWTKGGLHYAPPLR